MRYELSTINKAGGGATAPFSSDWKERGATPSSEGSHTGIDCSPDNQEK
jgi:hypothetical protein